MAVIAAILLSELAAVLLTAALAKMLAARRGRLSWPDPTLAGIRVPASAVIAAEAIAAGTVLFVPAPRTAAIVSAAMYAALSVSAWKLKGRTCSCFGANSSVVGPGHIASTIAASVLGIASAVTVHGSWGLPVAARAALLLGSATAVLIATSTRNKRSMRRRADALAASWDPARLSGAAGLVVMTSPGCSHCAALRVLLHGTIDSRLLTWVDIANADQAIERAGYPALAQDRTPCAIAVDDAGAPLAEPRWGTRDIPRLVDSFLLGR